MLAKFKAKQNGYGDFQPHINVMLSELENSTQVGTSVLADVNDPLCTSIILGTELDHLTDWDKSFYGE